MDDQPSDRAFAVVHDVAASWADYGRVRAALPQTGADLLLHAAGPTDEGFRTIDVWSSEAAWQRHRPRLERAFDPLTSAPAVRTLDVDHLVTAPMPTGHDRAQQPEEPTMTTQSEPTRTAPGPRRGRWHAADGATFSYDSLGEKL